MASPLYLQNQKAQFVWLKSIQYQNFDVLTIIRGGGAKLDLDTFNDYDLCKKHFMEIYLMLDKQFEILSSSGYLSKHPNMKIIV